MPSSSAPPSVWYSYLSPFKLVLLVTNAVCFGACVTLLVIGSSGLAVGFLTIGTGLSFVAGLTGAIVASRKRTADRAQA